MKRIIALASSLLALVGCSTPTAPAPRDAAARAAAARTALDGASKTSSAGTTKLATN